MQCHYTRYHSDVLISNPVSYCGVLNWNPKLGNYHLDFFLVISTSSHINSGPSAFCLILPKVIIILWINYM